MQGRLSPDSCRWPVAFRRIFKRPSTSWANLATMHGFRPKSIVPTLLVSVGVCVSVLFVSRDGWRAAPEVHSPFLQRVCCGQSNFTFAKTLTSLLLLLFLFYNQANWNKMHIYFIGSHFCLASSAVRFDNKM